MKLNNETKIGLMISVVLVILIGLTLKTGDFHLGQEGYEVKIHFQNIEGVELNVPVMFNGLEVGYVKDIQILEKDGESVMELTAQLNDEAKLRQGAKAYVKNMGFMGEKYIGLFSGEKEGEFLPTGSIITGNEPADIDQIMSDGQEIAAQLKGITTNVNERLTKNEEAIDAILVNLDTTLKNTASISNNLDQRLKGNERKIDEIIAHLHAASMNLDDMTYDLKANPWKLLYRVPQKRGKDAKK